MLCSLILENIYFYISWNYTFASINALLYDFWQALNLIDSSKHYIYFIKIS